MKNIYLFLCLHFILVSCSDWLDVKPRSENREQEHYAHEDGFKNTLIGVYIRMASANLYGREMTMLFPELLIQHWITKEDEVKSYHDIATYKYKETAVENKINMLWKEYYLAITNLNNLLANLEERKEVFAPGNYELIKGEALGLRAFLHFDLLRLFGPIPDATAESTIAIPYVKEVTKQIDQLTSVSYSQVIAHILEDLNEAETWLKNDPLVNYENDLLNDPGAYGAPMLDEFHYYRQNRFNLYAVKATKARVYLWIGDTQHAGQAAREVITAEKFRLALNSDLTVEDAEDRTFSKEHVFAICNSKLANIVTPLFKSGTSVLQRKEDVVNTLFEKNLNPEDIRIYGTLFWESREVTKNTYKYCYKKYDQNGEIVPLIRLAEMYLIAMECSSPQDALPLFKEFRISRKMNIDLETTLTDEQALMERIEKEYRKDFFAEGQMFFFCKRLAKKQIIAQNGTPMAMSLNNYVLPKPSGQLVFE